MTEVAWVTTKDGRQVNTDWFDKENQIAKNKEEARIRNEQLDMTSLSDSYANKKYNTRASQTYNNEHQQALRKLKENPSLLNDVDLKDPKQVIKLAKKLLTKASASCYAHAGCISAVFEITHTPYICYNGFAMDPNTKEGQKSLQSPKSIRMSNHTWIKANGIRYEYFEGTHTLVHHKHSILDRQGFEPEDIDEV